MPASYFPLDVNFFDHPKVVGLSDIALRMHLSAIGYANRLMTDGFVAEAIPRRLVEWDHYDSDAPTLDSCVVELVEAVLWHEADVPCPRGHSTTCPELPGVGWRIHDFLEHNRSKDERLRAQDAERDRKAAWREKQRKARSDAQASDPDSPIPGDASVPRDSAVPGDVGREHAGDAPETGNTETETETRDKIKPVVEQARPIDDTTAVFQAWQEAARKPRSRLDDKRRRRIKAALKHYPLEDVLDAVRGWQCSPHHCGQNPQRTVYNDLDLLLRDSAHIENFRDLWRGEGGIAAAEPAGFANLRRINAGELHP